MEMSREAEKERAKRERGRGRGKKSGVRCARLCVSRFKNIYLMCVSMGREQRGIRIPVK